jgi:hypothetical protein
MPLPFGERVPQSKAYAVAPAEYGKVTAEVAAGGRIPASCLDKILHRLLGCGQLARAAG